jgi:hypothetical protein
LIASRGIYVRARIEAGGGGQGGFARATGGSGSIIIDSPISAADREVLDGIIERLRKEPKEVRTRARSGGGGSGGERQVPQQGARLSADEAGDGGLAVARSFDPPVRRTESPRVHAGENPGAAAVVNAP